LRPLIVGSRSASAHWTARVWRVTATMWRYALRASMRREPPETARPRLYVEACGPSPDRAWLARAFVPTCPSLPEVERRRAALSTVRSQSLASSIAHHVCLRERGGFLPAQTHRLASMELCPPVRPYARVGPSLSQAWCLRCFLVALCSPNDSLQRSPAEF
jgi:hypothetical protein